MSKFLPIELGALLPVISAWLYTMIRVSSFFMAAPIFLQSVIPTHIRILFSVAISTFLTPQFLSTDTLPSLYSAAGVITVFQQVIIGIAMGFILQMTFEMLSLAGQFIATSMQFNFALTIDPSRQEQNNVLSNLYKLLCMLVFISSHGLHLIIGLLEKSFSTLPISSHSLSLEQLMAIPLWGTQMFSQSLSLALPVMSIIFIVNIPLAIMTRLAPALNIFSIGLPIILLVGLSAIILSLSFFVDHFIDILHNTYEFVLYWQTAK